MMKRLFMLRDESGRPFIQIPMANGPLCFDSKKAAKQRRDEAKEAVGYTLHVIKGPDHRNFT